MALSFWFLGVDRSWFVEKCQRCGYFSDTIQIRVFTIPVSEKIRRRPTLLQKIAEALGAECTHPGLWSFHKHRYWGLLICGSPCINGTIGVSGDISWYDHATSVRVKEMAEADPTLRQQFVDRVLNQRDWEYWSALVDKIHELRNATAH